jgi:hypothetical protein
MGRGAGGGSRGGKGGGGGSSDPVVNVLNRQIDSLQKNIDDLHAKGDPSKYNPIGEVGGIRSRSAKQKQRIMDTYDRTARESNKLVRERDALKRTVEAYPKLKEKANIIQRIIDNGGVDSKGRHQNVSILKDMLKETKSQIASIEKRSR